MTGPDNDTTAEMTAVLAAALRHHAGEAPSADGLPEKAMAVASRRRRRRINASIAAIVVLAVGIPVAILAAAGGGGDMRPAIDATWRWESYRNVQVQVPPDWAYGIPGPAWCTALPEGETRRIRPGVVGRPGDTSAILCPTEYPPVKQRENWLTFNLRGTVGERRFDGGWVEETRRVDGVYLTVFTNDDTLREAILRSAQPIAGTDRHGCATDHPVTADPAGYRPDPAGGGLPPADTVESISVCRYEMPSDSAAPLLSSARITGARAQEVVGAIRSAPEGEGPDEEAEGPGTEIAVLRITTADGVREVVMHYSGASGNGFDDGTTKRELTAAAIRPLLSGANTPMQMYLPVARLLGI
jgi:hypothetical protein